MQGLLDRGADLEKAGNYTPEWLNNGYAVAFGEPESERA